MRGGGATPAELERARVVAEEIRERLLAVNRELAAIAGQVQVLDSCWFAEMQGYCSTGDWLRHECRLSWGLAYDLAAVGEQWHNVGQSVLAVEAGGSASVTPPTSPAPASASRGRCSTRPA